MAQSFGPQEAFGYLVDQGYSPVQAAAIAGNIQQESSFNPNNLNQGEGAYGLIQWRQDRRQALEDFARQRGTDPSDPYTQLDFIGHEMRGSEAKSGAPFMAAQDLPSANAALKKYIRYGDNSDATRLKYASAFMGGGAQPTAVAATAAPQQQMAGLLSPDQPQKQTEGLLSPSQGQQGQGLLGNQFDAPPEIAHAAMRRKPIDLSRLQAMVKQTGSRRAWG